MLKKIGRKIWNDSKEEQTRDRAIEKEEGGKEGERQRVCACVCVCEREREPPLNRCLCCMQGKREFIFANNALSQHI